MRIAQVAPLYESVPPRLYGGTERVVSYLTEELVKRGHNVTLFASGDSVTSAELVSAVPQSLRLTHSTEFLSSYALQLEQVRKRAREFDIIHLHDNFTYFPLLRVMDIKFLSTLHGRLDLPIHQSLFRAFREMPVVSISWSQRGPLSTAKWIGNVYHGLPVGAAGFVTKPSDDYLAFLGRLSPEKGVDKAIEIARRAGMKLRIAGKVDDVDAEYFREEVEPLLNSSQVEFLGEIDERDKPSFLGNARAVLFPIAWPEAFGLVLIESMAAGTPVIAWRRASVPEVVDDGVTGVVVETIDHAVTAIQQVSTLDRELIRERFEERFTAERMACDYLSIYQTVLTESPSSDDQTNTRKRPRVKVVACAPGEQ